MEHKIEENLKHSLDTRRKQSNCNPTPERFSFSKVKDHIGLIAIELRFLLDTGMPLHNTSMEDIAVTMYKFFCVRSDVNADF